MWNDLSNQAQLEGLLRGHDALAHQEVQRTRHAEMLDEKMLPPLVRQQPEAQGCTAEPRLDGGDAKIAGECQREAGNRAAVRAEDQAGPGQVRDHGLLQAAGVMC